MFLELPSVAAEGILPMGGGTWAGRSTEAVPEGRPEAGGDGPALWAPELRPRMGVLAPLDPMGDASPAFCKRAEAAALALAVAGCGRAT